MHGAHGDSRDCHAAEYVTADLEKSHWKSVFEDDGGGVFEVGEADERRCEEETVACDERKLDEGESHWEVECEHDLLSGVGGHRGGHVPERTECDKAC